MCSTKLAYEIFIYKNAQQRKSRHTSTTKPSYSRNWKTLEMQSKKRSICLLFWVFQLNTSIGLRFKCVNENKCHTKKTKFQRTTLRNITIIISSLQGLNNIRTLSKRSCESDRSQFLKHCVVVFLSSEAIRYGINHCMTNRYDNQSL